MRIFFLLFLALTPLLRADYLYDDYRTRIQEYCGNRLTDEVFFKYYHEPEDSPAIEFHDIFLKKKYAEKFDSGRLTITTRDIPLGPTGNEHPFRLKVYECVTPGVEEFHNLFYICGGCDDLHTGDSKIDSFLHGFFDGDHRKNLRIISYSFYEPHHSEEERWVPEDRLAMGMPPLLLMRKLHEEGTSIDTLVWFSIGSMVCEGLCTVDPSEDLSWLPRLFVSDRGMPSVWKTGQRLVTNPVKFNAFYSMAYMSNWHADPEMRLVEFFDKMQEHPNKPEIAIIELSTDYYFSGETGFEPDFEEELSSLGVTCYRGLFSLPDTPFHGRAHHNLPMHEIHVLPSAEAANFFPIHVGESVAHALIRSILD